MLMIFLLLVFGTTAYDVNNSTFSKVYITLSNKCLKIQKKRYQPKEKFYHIVELLLSNRI